MASKSYIDPETGKDTRYDLIKVLVEDGKIECFTDIFKFVPKTTVARDIEMGSSTWNRSMNGLVNIPLQKFFAIARLCDITERQIMELIINEYEKRRKK